MKTIPGFHPTGRFAIQIRSRRIGDEIVRGHCKGEVYLCRYADDFVCAFELESDAQCFYEVLPKRLAKFGLEVAAEKTNIIRFDRKSKLSFEFLGFEFSWGRGRSGNIILKRRTSRKKYRAALANLTAWCQDCLVVCP
ncbi:MAG: reverse transcriptase domain-containing protein, partial [Methylococcales bacterium]